jgi:Cu2+-exporting ATPase
VRENAGDAVESIARETPQMALRVREGGREENVSAAKLVPGDLVRIATGAADSCRRRGRRKDARGVEEALLYRREPSAHEKTEGDSVLAGSLNRASPLLVRVTAAGEHTALAALSRLVARAGGRPASHRAAVRSRRHCVRREPSRRRCAVRPCVVVGRPAARAAGRTFAVLVVSCPCALSLAIPAALASAAGALGRRQVLCVRPDALEALSLTRVTLRRARQDGHAHDGDLRVNRRDMPLRKPVPMRCMVIAAALEHGSSHPIARALAQDHAGDVQARDKSPSSPVAASEGSVDGGALSLRAGRSGWRASARRPCRSRMRRPPEKPS